MSGAYRFELKNGTTAEWAASSLVLREGEPGLDTDLKGFKVGDGISVWANLDWWTASIEQVIASDPAPVPPGAAVHNELYITDLATDATFAEPSGPASNRNGLLIRIEDDGTARALDWDAVYHAVSVTLPDSTVPGKITYVGARRNSLRSRWDVIAVGQED